MWCMFVGLRMLVAVLKAEKEEKDIAKKRNDFTFACQRIE